MEKLGFIVWNKKENKWEPEEHLVLKSSGELDGLRAGMNTDDCIPVFDTGVKDSQGTPIYMGDVVRVQYSKVDAGSPWLEAWERDYHLLVEDYFALYELVSYGDVLTNLGSSYDDPSLIEIYGV